MGKKILKVNSILLITICFILLLISTAYMFLIILMPFTDDWAFLGKFVIIIWTEIIYILNIPSIISGMGTLKYLKGKDNYKFCMIFNIIGIILYILFILIFIYFDKLNFFEDHVTGFINVKLKILLTFIIFILFILPLIINRVIMYKNKNNLDNKMVWKHYQILVILIIIIILTVIIYNIFKLNVINNKKIEINQDNMRTYSDFKKELENRNLIYELPKNKSELTGIKKFLALDSTSKFGYEFSDVDSDNDSDILSVNSKRKFPLFVYDSYTSLIKKSPKTAYYYYIGPEDWYINWYIYYVNGEIYAAIGEESEYGLAWDTSLSTTKYGIVVSEKNDITIYNAKNNYYVKDGGIIDTASGMQITSFPTTSDIYNKKCMEIRIVDRVDAKTLDEIAKELSPQYWKIYKKY